ncbi:MAG: ribosome biogenesis GTPase Der [Chloroflexi bacterium]|nr:ribosome biogenesis GTPase Der [Chloroflexota bacterium]MDL1883050.1 ribosome biogenesis GTPase Der [Anaerolineae bacterium CFX8]
MARKPVVALVGRPNVGKSTLFNRLVGERMAVTDAIPGTTRDRLQAQADWRGLDFDVIDTGGIEIYQPKGSRDTSPLAEGSIDFVEQIKEQAFIAVSEADVIVLLVDAVHGITAADQEIAEILRRNEGKPILVAANKADNPKVAENAVEFYGLGLGPVFPISAYHGIGVGDLLDAVVDALRQTPAEEKAEDHEDILKIAIVGRPNVGKSSLLNLLLGEERVIVSPIAGTTRDAIDTEITWHGMTVRLVDTAGIRKRGKIESGVEKFSVLRTMRALERSDVALLLLDAVDGITEQDLHIAGYITEAGKSVVIVVNKWDAVEKDTYTMNQYMENIRQKFDFLPDPPIIFISALTGQRVHQVLETANRVWEGRFQRIATADLNRILRAAMQKHPAPAKGTRRLKIYYATQVSVNPPVFLFHVNDTRLVHFTYQRFLENQIRAEFPFEGTPIRLSFRPREGMLDE